MLASLFFILTRISQLLTLIPTLGMLAYFVDGYTKANQLTPVSILTLFIVSVLAAAWALVTVLRMSSTRRSAAFVAFVDLLFVGAFIAGVYELRGIASANCVDASGGLSSSSTDNGNGGSVTVDYSPFEVAADKTCAMLKASFAFGIMNCLFFAWSCLMAMFLHRGERVVVEKTTYRSRSHGSR